MRALAQRFVAVSVLAGFIALSVHSGVADEPAHTKGEPRCTTLAVCEAEDGFTAIRKKLNKPISVAFTGKPLNDVLGELSDELGVDVVFDRIERGSFTGPVHLTLTRCPGKVVLRQALHQLDENLDYAVRDGFVLIAKRERLDVIYEARVYRHGVLPSVSQVLPPAAHATNGPAHEFRSLVSVIEPHSWEQGGGSARMAYINGNLIVWQTPRVHEQIGDLFERIRTADDQDMRDFQRASQSPAISALPEAPPALPLPTAPSTLERNAR